MVIGQPQAQMRCLDCSNKFVSTLTPQGVVGKLVRSIVDVRCPKCGSKKVMPDAFQMK